MTSKDAQTTDLRVRRTRMMIEKAFAELLMERGFQAVTVQDIADRAMVNRATFYDHFTDKYELFEHSMRLGFRQTLESKLPANFTYCASNLRFLIATVCEFIAEVDDHCKPTNPQGLPSFDKQVVELVSEVLSNSLAESRTENGIASAPLAAEVASWAMYGAALHWSLQKHREPLEEFAGRVAAMISALIGEGDRVGK